jgi:hypothetical protein
MTTKTVWLAGTSFYDMKRFLEGRSFPTGLPLILEREPTNQYDKNAAVVFLEASALRDAGYELPEAAMNIERFKLGHVPAKDGTAAWLAPLMDAGKAVSARFDKHGPATGIQITINVED